MIPVGTSKFRKVRVTTTAVNKLTTTPRNRVVAKPTMIVAPKFVPKA